MTAIVWTSNACLVVGTAFFFAGTVGLLRFPDVYTRLHALAKADNLGLGFTLLGLLCRTANPAGAVKLVFVWLLVLIASALVSYLIARRASGSGIDYWRAPERQA